MSVNTKNTTTATTATTPVRSKTAGNDQQVILGIKQDLQSMTSLPLGGTTYTPQSLVAVIQSRIDATNAVVTAKANWQSAAKTYKAIDAQVTVIVRELRNLVIGAFGATSPKLADFGFSNPTRKPQTTAEKQAAALKRTATREARGTRGKQQKLKITGATAAAAPPATPAPAAPAAPAPQPVAPAPAASAPAPSVASPPAPAPHPGTTPSQS
jgi:hypothetical protein